MGRLALLMFVAGCWGSTSAAPVPVTRPVMDPPPTMTVKSHRKVAAVSRCVRAIDNAIEKFRPELDKIQGMAAREPLLRDAAVLGCETTGWSEEATTCFETAADVGSMMSCRVKLTHDQSRDLNDRMRDVMNVSVP